MLPFLPAVFKRLVMPAGLAAGLIFGFAGNAAGQATGEAPQAPTAADPVMFPHLDGTRYFIAGQANIIFQAHAPFHSPYEGVNSLLGRGEYKTSLVGTLFLGAELVRNPARHLEVLYDEESAGGRRISEALGLAGVHQPGRWCGILRLGPVPYLARVQVHGNDQAVEQDGGGGARAVFPGDAGSGATD